ncbi:hypothetical protein SR914_11860 [Comamonas testosteroni]|uniref:Uncharacterized protein n=1 Tax=Comamonas testosteroni (strain DSM 14576 / KF-1) TaxID=399795 RepID=B7WUI0_COMTK|nr:hypothetical protein [Comamonas testosteroni]EED65664.1 hypothetical protein CtesDRAFT_PD0610 [Comamonas testosteroni KF-1]WQG69065.1 hypothetical protein SR914_11860 [Comamonas testosteroni]
MSQSTNPNVVTLTVTEEAAHFILSCVADRPYKQVAPLFNELQAQVQVQANTRGAESADSPAEADANASQDATGQPKGKRGKASANAAA